MSDAEDVEEAEQSEQAEQDGSQKSDNEENDAPEKEEPKVLTEEIAGQNLSLLCKSGDGLSHAFVRIDLKEKNLVDINLLQGYIHLRYVDVSKNKLTDLSPLNNLTHLLSLKADNNNLETIGLRPFPFLQQASFSFNQINTTSGLEHPLLEQLNLSNNHMETMKGLGGGLLGKLNSLDISTNKIQSIEELNIPSLKTLNIVTKTNEQKSWRKRGESEKAAENKQMKSVSHLMIIRRTIKNDENAVTNLNGISRMNNLENLHARKNQITELTCFSEPFNTLKSLDIGENLIEGIEEIEKLKGLTSLQALSFSANPVCNEEGFRVEVLMHLQSINKLNEDDVAEEEKLEALEIAKQRQLEKEKGAELEETDNV